MQYYIARLNMRMVSHQSNSAQTLGSEWYCLVALQEHLFMEMSVSAVPSPVKGPGIKAETQTSTWKIVRD